MFFVTSDRLRVLLFSPFGCGEHYNGPASFSHRLYSVDPGRFDVTLVHGFPDQEPTATIDRAIFLTHFKPGPLGQLRWIRASRRWLDRHAGEFDVFHGMLGFHCTMAPAHHADRRLGLPAAVFIANHRADLSRKGGLKGLLGLGRARQQMAREISSIIGMSTEIRDELREYGVREDRIFDIPMGVDLSRFSRPTQEDRARLRERWGLESSTTIAFSGELSRRKRPHLLIEALGNGVRRGRDWTILLAGPEPDAEYSAECRALAAELGVADRVRWIGFTREVEAVYGAADLYCLPSSNEGMPASVVEAMASGLPPVITRFSSAKDLVAASTMGRVVEPTGVEIADAVDALSSDAETLSMAGFRAAEHARSRFDARAVLDRYEEMFRSISSKSRN